MYLNLYIYFRKVVIFSILCFLSSAVYSQNGVLKGTIKDKLTNQPLIGANVEIINTTTGTVTDLDGKYILENLKPGLYTIEVTYIGYDMKREAEIEVQQIRPTILNFELTENAKQLSEIVIKTSSFKKTAESPLSLRTIGISEIKRNPGANRDISRVIQSLPGVTSTASFRNDLIIRGGAPNENRFYIDDVEVPVINHFATQGSSGGPAGIINVDFVREVDFYSGAFPVNRGNALSSVFNFKYKEGRDDRIGATTTVGATDIGVTLDGPIGKKSNFLVSARRSYLQFLFKAIGLPFLPTYNDFNVKYKYKINPKNEIYFIGLGAVDKFELNLAAGTDETNQFILAQIPVNNQWNYTNGLVYKRYGDNGYTTFVLSRNMLNNEATKYRNNTNNPADLTLNYRSQEIENKLRVETFQKRNGIEFMIGGAYEFVKYNNRTFSQIFTSSGAQEINFNSNIAFHKYGFFANSSKKFINDKLNVSLGLRLDGNSFSDDMANPLDQFSPRLSISYALTEKLNINFNAGQYFQLPPYTVLGYRENEVLVNKQNNVKYIGNQQLVAGVEYNISTTSRITLEGYYKKYSNYPWLSREQISLANLGGDFGVIGNEPVFSISDGRTYGLEVLLQQRLYRGFYGIVALTFGRSEFTNMVDNYAPSSWDSRAIANITLGKKLGKNWEVGTRFRYQSGLPFTPFAANSDLVTNWNRNFGGRLDFNQINTQRRGFSNGLDLRIDKKWFFTKWELNLFLDLQNVTAATVATNRLILDRPLDDTGLPIGDGIIVNPNDPIDQQRFLVKNIPDNNGTVLPTLGIIISL